MKSAIETSPLFDYTSRVLTKDKNSYNDYTRDQFVKTNDEILILFNNENITTTELSQLMSDYSLLPVHIPSSSMPTARWTYAFKIKEKVNAVGEKIHTTEIAQYLGLDDRIYSAEPNLGKGKPHHCPGFNETTNQTTGYNHTWHISNDDNYISPGLTIFTPINDADADICECWQEGYTGLGVRIGVMDNWGINFNHDDMRGVIVSGIEVINSSSHTSLSTDRIPSVPKSHFMQVAGVIAANANNFVSMSDRPAIGVAYNSKIVPILLPDNFYSIDVIYALQTILLDNTIKIDVLNMSFQTPLGFSLLNDLDNLAIFGRDGKGIVMIASTGNNNNNTTKVYPAAAASTIGVGGSNPSDQRMSYSSPASWAMNPNQGSGYGPPDFNYHVVAPSEEIVTTDLMEQHGIEPGNYSLAIGTSFASAIVSGIAAILLEKNPSLIWTEVRDILINTADKVNPNLYDYNQFPGYSGYNEEMFYGRVNCFKALQSTPLSIKEASTLQDLTLIRSENNFILSFNHNAENYNVLVFDAMGRTLPAPIEKNNNTITVNTSTLANGLYIITIFNGNIHQSVKIIK